MDNNKNFKDYIETLPPEIKQAIYSIDYPQKLQEIVKNNKLMIDQAGKLEAETTLVMAGIEPMDKYIANLISNVGLSSIQASAVAHDVNESIFKNIRESLKKINDQIVEEEKTISESEVNSAPVIEKANVSLNTPTKEEILTQIESPENIKTTEESVSISSLKSNSANPETHETIDKGIEIKVNNFPELTPKTNLPAILSSLPKKPESFHQNVAPVKNIIESKLTSIIAVPKETIIIEDKAKIPQKPKMSEIPQKPRGSFDPYREITN